MSCRTIGRIEQHTALLYNANVPQVDVGVQLLGRAAWPRGIRLLLLQQEGSSHEVVSQVHEVARVAVKHSTAVLMAV